MFFFLPFFSFIFLYLFNGKMMKNLLHLCRKGRRTDHTSWRRHLFLITFTFLRFFFFFEGREDRSEGYKY